MVITAHAVKNGLDNIAGRTKALFNPRVSSEARWSPRFLAAVD
jgi:hypothetical protein